ncbi:MAG TPA: PilZ domain-containing protein [Thermotogota bacterium]|nr:PilZ domain-containing protein [Thermotogota bacterium]HRW93144.1 PilZ domain-containing protein [Thermotogota bacterium]
MGTHEKIAFFLRISNWKSLLRFPSQLLSCIYLGKSHGHLVFESRFPVPHSENIQGQILDFEIFLPKMVLRGKGMCTTVSGTEDSVFGKISRFHVQVEDLRSVQQRNFKRFFLLEEIRVGFEENSYPGVLTDISITGAGIVCEERLFFKEGTLFHPRFYKGNVDVVRVHEYTDFNFFHYGFLFLNPAWEQKEKIKEWLLEIDGKFQKMGILL